MRNSIKKSFKAYFAKENIGKNLMNLFLLLLGTFVLTIASGFFLVPFQIVSGGMTGITIITSSFIPADIMSYILSWGFFILGFIVLGFKFTISSLVSTIFYPIFLSLILRTGMLEPFLKTLTGVQDLIIENGVIMNLSSVSVDNGLLLIIGILGGALTGIGCSLTFQAGGSTGGLDILTFIISKYTGLKESVSFFILDAVIVGTGIIMNLVSGDNVHLITGLIGVITAFVCSMLVELMYSGKATAYEVDIISDKPDEILDFVINDLERSATIFEVQGGFTKEKKILIRVCFSRREYVKIKNGIAKIDHNAFCTFNQTLFVGGEGFEKIKTNEFESFKYLKKINKFNKKENTDLKSDKNAESENNK